MTQNSLSKTEKQISTGLAISSASDNASYWSIATKMSSNIGALGAVNTVLFRNGRRIGHNTDWSGFAEPFRARMAAPGWTAWCSSAPAGPGPRWPMRC